MKERQLPQKKNFPAPALQESKSRENEIVVQSQFVTFAQTQICRFVTTNNKRIQSLYCKTHFCKKSFSVVRTLQNQFSSPSPRIEIVIQVSGLFPLLAAGFKYFQQSKHEIYRISHEFS